MGFENRRSLRIKTNISLCYWPSTEATGAPRWGKAVNLSETGLALSGALPLPNDHTVLVEFSLHERRQPLQVPAAVIHCDDATDPADGCVLRLRFGP